MPVVFFAASMTDLVSTPPGKFRLPQWAFESPAVTIGELGCVRGAAIPDECAAEECVADECAADECPADEAVLSVGAPSVDASPKVGGANEEVPDNVCLARSPTSATTPAVPRTPARISGQR